MSKFLRYVIGCALSLILSMSVNAQTHLLPSAFNEWMRSPGMKHATVTMEVAKLNTQKQAKIPAKNYTTLYQYDTHRLMTPASVMKLVTTAAALRLLGGDYVMPDSAALVDTTLQALPGLEGYNKDWLIEDIGEDYIPALQNQLPDSGRVLRDVVHDTNVESLNNQAETIMRLMDAECRLDSALVRVSDYWKSRGLDTECLVMYDGCGLAPSDRVTSNFIIELLADMQDDADFVNSLAVAGRDGTLKRFLLKTRLEGQARLKSGTLKTVVAYAGYVPGRDGSLYAVCIFANSFTCKVREVRKGMEKVLLSLIP